MECIYLREAIIAKAKELHPEAENTVEALDLYAQDIYKEIRRKHQEEGTRYIDMTEDVEYYGNLRAMRIEELEKGLRESSFTVVTKEAAYGN